LNLNDTSQELPQAEKAAASSSSPNVPVHGDDSPSFAHLWARLKEHKVAQWTLAYGAFAYALLHGATLLSDALDWPHMIVRVLALLLLVALPIVPVLAWYHGVRALRRISGSELSLIALLLAIGGSLMWLYPHPAAERSAARLPIPAAPLAVAAARSPAVFAPPAHSIAVLPFVNMSGDAKEEYFSDGITEEVLNALSRLNDLQVVARTSSFSFKGQNVDVATIAHRLNVGALLEGSVRRAGKTVRITVQLINAVSGFHVWSQTYDRNLTDILKLQADVASAVAQQLEVRLAGDVVAKIEAGGTRDPAAYDAYLRGLQWYENVDANLAAYRAALAAFEEAIALDPNFAMAYTRRAAALDYIYRFADDTATRKRLNQQARAAAEKAIALAPELGEAHVALAYTYYRGTPDVAAAAREYERALALSPGSAWVQRGFGWFAAQLGHFEPAVAAARRAVSLDPQNARTRLVLAEVLVSARRYAEAQTVLQDALVLSPHAHDLQSLISETLLASAQYEKARRFCESPSTPLDDDDRQFCLALVYHALGRQADAERQLERLKTTVGFDAESLAVAEVYAQWGNKADALQWLTKAEQSGSFELISIRVNWALDPLRNEPQFKALEARMHFPP
jgi:TolB-like protein/Tfp pilus assembly protein PilF